jgi:hypothetical protein
MSEHISLLLAFYSIFFKLMKSSFQEFAAIIYPSLNEKIANADGMAGIERISRILPHVPVITESGFECHLSKENSTADMSVAFSKSNRNMIIDSFESLPCLSDNSRSWKRVYELICKWNNEDSLLYENIENIWLEFDIDSESSNIPEPSVFFSPHPTYLKSSEATSNFFRYQWIIEEVLESLIDAKISDDTRESLCKCFDLLPKGGNIFQVGVMLPRLAESKAIRLCIQGIEISSIINYLNSIGWHDSSGELAVIINQLSFFVDSVAINISIENGIYPKIGIECYIEKQPKNSSKWSHLFDFMLSRNLCTEDKVAGLLEWPGYLEEKYCTQAWPENLSTAAMFVYPKFRSAATRSISHIKIVYQPMMPLQAKAYLWFGHRWIEPNGILQT